MAFDNSAYGIQSSKKTNFFLLDEFKNSSKANKRIWSNLELLTNLKINELIICGDNKVYHFSNSVKSKHSSIDFKKSYP